MSHPETWAKKKKQDPLGGTYVSPRDVGKKKTRPARGDVCLTQGCGQRNETHVGQYPVPSHWVMEERLIDAPPPIKGGHRGLSCPPPDKKGGAYCCPSLQSPPVKERHRSSSHVPLGSSPHAPPHHIRSNLNERENQLKNNKTVMYSSEVLESFFIRYSL